MRKASILLTILLLTGFIMEMFIPVVSGEEKYSELSTVGLKLGWGVKFAQKYVVKLVDVDQNWTMVRINIYENGNPTAKFILKEGEVGYYPQENNVIFRVKVVGIWKDKGVVYVKIGTPLKLLDDKVVIYKGSSYTIPSPFPRYKIKVIEVPSDSKATLEITYPDGSSVRKVIEKDSPVSIPYKVSDEFVQSSYILIELVSAEENKKIVVNVYGAKMTFQGAQIVKPEEKPSEEETKVTEVSQEVYGGLLYVGETLTIEYNNTKYGLKLLSVGYYSRFELLNSKGEVMEKFSIREGNIYQLVKAPFRIEIPPNSVDLTYNRTYIRVFGPLGALALPIIRQANVTAELAVNEKQILLNGDELVVFIKVKNLGRGNAFQVKVIAPVPNNFQLRSGIGTWTLNTLEAYSEMPVLVYTLKPTKVGEYKLGPVLVEYYNEAGEKVTVKSNVIEKIIVYGTPEIKLEAKVLTDNKTWSNYVDAKVNSTIRLRFKVSTEGESGEYEFIKNASIIVNMGDFLDGKEVIPIGYLPAGKEKVVEGQYLVLKKGIHRIGVTLVYQDPLGNWHRISYPNLILINSIPPKVIVKKEVVEKWPEPNELPGYIDTVLSTLSNPTPLAEKIVNVSSKYVKQEQNTGISATKVLGVITIILGVALIGTGYMAVKYRNDLEALKAKKKKSRPGGLPKKEEEQITEQKSEEKEGEIELLS
ncbi:TPA: DNA cytosine methyltransferase [Pyrococcus horikoshii]|nr:DNA cytosine methyltransferase [Pyrococcus horikoshii]